MLTPPGEAWLVERLDADGVAEPVGWCANEAACAAAIARFHRQDEVRRRAAVALSSALSAWTAENTPADIASPPFERLRAADPRPRRRPGQSAAAWAAESDAREQRMAAARTAWRVAHTEWQARVEAERVRQIARLFKRTPEAYDALPGCAGVVRYRCRRLPAL